MGFGYGGGVKVSLGYEWSLNVHIDSRWLFTDYLDDVRSEERRVGKECRSRWSPYH